MHLCKYCVDEDLLIAFPAIFQTESESRNQQDNMSILREGMCSGFTANIVEKLRSNGISKLTDLISRDTEDVCQLTGVSYKVCFKVIGFRA